MAMIQLGEISVSVIQKDIKNVHLSVYPPDGRVTISAPVHLDLETIRVYAISRLGWIKKQRTKIQSQARETPREFLNKESHYFLGKRFLLKIIEQDEKPKVVLKHSAMELYVRPGSDVEKKKEVLDAWYRRELRERVLKMIPPWEKRMGVQVGELGIKKMKTKWGTCNPEAGRVWLNLELAKKPVQCIEYILVHEMVHLLERSHNSRFVALMDKHLPHWRLVKEELNRIPVSHVDWGY